MLAIGGYNGVDRLQTVEVLDGPKRVWRSIGSMNCKRSAAGAAALHDYLYVRKISKTLSEKLVECLRT